MIKQTILAASITLALATVVPSAQAGTLSTMLGGLFDGHGATTNFEARRGGGFRNSRSSSRRSATSSSRAVAPVNRNTSTTSTNNTTNTNRNTTNQTNQQQDAQFSQNAYRGNTTGTNTGTVGNNMPTSRTGTGYNQPGTASYGSMGMGSTFLSSLAGAGAGVLLANMLLSPSAAAAQGTEQATPEMLSDTQISECLDQLKTDLADAEARLADASDEEKAALREQISQMHNLQIALMSEQLNRLKGTTETAG